MMIARPTFADERRLSHHGIRVRFYSVREPALRDAFLAAALSIVVSGLRLVRLIPPGEGMAREYNFDLRVPR
jgi:hypothetical protein